MSEIIAICGLDCAKCAAFRATQNNDITEKKKIAERWTQNEFSKKHNLHFTADDITCYGCMSKKISGWCTQICDIRPCAQKRGVKTCAHCEDYICERLQKFLKDEPEATKNLDVIHKSL